MLNNANKQPVNMFADMFIYDILHNIYQRYIVACDTSMHAFWKFLAFEKKF